MDATDFECCVCYEPTNVTTPCNHRICYKCLNRLDKQKCPICRQKITNMFNCDKEYTLKNLEDITGLDLEDCFHSCNSCECEFHEEDDGCLNCDPHADNVDCKCTSIDHLEVNGIPIASYLIKILKHSNKKFVSGWNLKNFPMIDENLDVSNFVCCGWTPYFCDLDAVGICDSCHTLQFIKHTLHREDKRVVASSLEFCQTCLDDKGYKLQIDYR